jgi:hypothetical protein
MPSIAFHAKADKDDTKKDVIMMGYDALKTTLTAKSCRDLVFGRRRG